ncbi:MAG: response regulator [Gallionella sp.]|nr:response regulator [Gallionella sp.]
MKSDNDPTILVVDDDANLSKTIADILRLKGYQVITAATGVEAIAAAEHAFINVALIDLMLPDMDGIEVMTRIKHASPLTEAIILTGHASMDTAVEATNRGAFSYLLKPYEIDRLLRHIRRALDRQKTQQEILWLASFPGMNPNPVLEVDTSGDITYLNPAARRIFPDLTVGQPSLGMLGDLSNAASNEERQVRELKVSNATFEQFITPVPDSCRIRIYMLDITELKESEAKLNRINQLLRTIRNINEYLLVAQSEEALYRFICEAMKELEDINGAIIGIRLPDSTLKPVAWAGFSEAMISALAIPTEAAISGSVLTGSAVREGRPVIIADIEHDPRYLPWKKIVRDWQLKSLVAVPLVADGMALGELAVYSGQRNAFDEEVTHFLVEVARDIALGVHALRLDKRLHATLDSLRKSLDGTVETIASMVELRDPYTAGHERRVAQLACAIGHAMGLPERQVEGLRVIGYLHDIGKIAVPAEILSKPALLTKIELLLVRAHAQTGYDILKNLEFPWPVAQAVLQHHERFDGSGYPQGLKETEIILEARILMVADVIEAMVSHRPYRPAIGQDVALAEIAAHRGQLYDERVVDACIHLFTEQGFQFDNHG